MLRMLGFRACASNFAWVTVGVYQKCTGRCRPGMPGTCRRGTSDTDLPSTGHNCKSEREEDIYGLSTKHPLLSGEGSQLLQPRVLHLGLLKDGNVRVGVVPERQEILVGGAGLGERIGL